MSFPLIPFLLVQVGSGKSSILAALLGELQPIGGSGGAQNKAGSGNSGAGPLVSGSVAYCCQVPWVVAGTVQARVLPPCDTL